MFNAFYICSYHYHHASYYLHSSVRKQYSPRAVFPLPPVYSYVQFDRERFAE